MKVRDFVSIAWLILGAGIVTAAILGPLGARVIEHRLTVGMETQMVGGDVVLLAIAAPAAFITGLLWRGGSLLAPLVGVSTAPFAAYHHFSFILAPEYVRYEGNNENYYPLFAGVLALSVTLAVLSWSRLSSAAAPTLGSRLRRTTAIVLFAVVGLFALAWSSQIADVVAGNFSAEYLEHPTAFWLIRTMDFALLMPAAVATAIGLIKAHPAAIRAGCALAGFLTLMLASIGGMAVATVVADDPSADPAALLVLIPAGLGLTALTFVLWRSYVRAAPVAALATTGDRLSINVSLDRTRLT